MAQSSSTLASCQFSLWRFGCTTKVSNLEQLSCTRDDNNAPTRHGRSSGSRWPVTPITACPPGNRQSVIPTHLKVPSWHFHF
jgi:hypothetical protein